MSEFAVVEVDNPELKSGDKGTSTGAEITSSNIDANTEALHVDGSKVTQPVSAASLPLPSGAATESTLLDVETETAAVKDRIGDTATPAAGTVNKQLGDLVAKDFATETTQATLATETTAAEINARIGDEATPAAGTVNKHLEDLVAKDFATETTQATLATETTAAEINARLGDETTPAAGTVNKQLGDLVAKDFATEARLVEVETNQTDGTQKTQIVSSTGDPIAVDANGLIATKVHDQEGNAYLIADGVAIPVGTKGPLTLGKQHDTGVAKYVTTITDPTDALEERMQTQARLAPGSTVSIGNTVPADPTDLVLSFLENSGSNNLLVDGSAASVEFSYAPTAGQILALQSLLIVFTADDFEFNGASFGPLNALTNGIKIEVTVSATTTELFNIKQNEDYLRTPGRLPLINNTGPKDLLGAEFSFGGLIKLVGDDGDKISMTVRDDLISTKLKYLTATVFGVNE